MIVSLLYNCMMRSNKICARQLKWNVLCNFTLIENLLAGELCHIFSMCKERRPSSLTYMWSIIEYEPTTNYNLYVQKHNFNKMISKTVQHN